MPIKLLYDTLFQSQGLLQKMNYRNVVTGIYQQKCESETFFNS